MQLTEQQQSSVREWAAAGATLGEIQKRLADEFEIRLSFMDTRFLVSDLKVSIQGKEKPAEKKSDAPAGVDSDLIGGGGVTVDLDSVARPGTMISGKVTFSDGETATWDIDQTGQPGLEPTTPGYQPSREDLEEFQKGLSKAAQESGL
ncbi:MAG: hypothetical protein ACI8UO_001672 [Verrucomicrobiales bacterium]|jgi:hypothetical protein